MFIGGGALGLGGAALEMYDVKEQQRLRDQ